MGCRANLWLRTNLGAGLELGCWAGLWPRANFGCCAGLWHRANLGAGLGCAQWASRSLTESLLTFST